MQKKVILTGGRGFVGTRIHRQLQTAGIETIVITQNHPVREGTTAFSVLNLLTDPNVEETIKRMEATHLIHLAWSTEHGKFWNTEENLKWVDASIRLTKAFLDSGGQHTVVAGTAAEYGNAPDVCCEDETPSRPDCLYAVAKDATRCLLSSLCDSRKSGFAWGRIFIPFGAGEDKRRLLPSLFDVFDNKREPFGVNGNAKRDFMHVEDVAAAFVVISQTESTGVFNICSGRPRAISDVVKEVASSKHRDPSCILELKSERQGEASEVVGDPRRLRSLGWRQKLDGRIVDVYNSVLQ